MLIGLLGRARNGKTTVAEAVQKQAHKMELSAEIYDIGALVLAECIEEGALTRKTRAELSRSELEVMVWWGKKKRDEQGESYWLKKLEKQIEDDGADVAIIPNIRYTNEAWFVAAKRGITIKVVSLNPNGSEFISPDRDPNHPSETEIINYPADYYLTARRGDPILLSDLAATLFSRVWRLGLN